MEEKISEVIKKLSFLDKELLIEIIRNIKDNNNFNVEEFVCNKMGDNINPILKEVQLSKLMKLGNDIYMSEDIDRLPKNGIIVQHRFHDKFKFNGLGIFCSEIGGTHKNDYGKNKTYVYIGPSSKIITINSTEDYLIKKGLLEQDDETYELYFSDNPTERFNNDSNLYYYILQKKALNMLQQEHGKFDVLEMLFEDELTYHQYLIIKNPE